MNAVAAYLARAGLTGRVSPDQAAACRDELQTLIDPTLVPEDTESLYRYPVPLLGDDGACSLVNQLAPKPYDLARALGGVAPETSRKLAILNTLVEATRDRADIGWLGVYQNRAVGGGRALVKLAYRGKPSRAEFPLTSEFAAYSNNSTVGMSGEARIIDDIGAYQRDGGVYYNCDPLVQSEACLPLFDASGRVIGIIDGEDSRLARFDGKPLLWIIGLALSVEVWLPA